MPKIKATDKVKITKPGTFKDLEGEVVSIGKSDLPYKVSLGPCGTWNFNDKQIEPLNKIKK